MDVHKKIVKQINVYTNITQRLYHVKLIHIGNNDLHIKQIHISLLTNSYVV